MVLLIIIPMKNGYFIGKINPTFSDKPIFHITGGITHVNEMHPQVQFQKKDESTRTNQAFHRELADICC